MQLELNRLRRTVRRRPFLDMTPLIDTVFNLLIFFAVTTTVASSSAAMKVDLPRAEAAVQQSGSLVISIDRSGGIQLNDVPVDWDTLRSELKTAGSESPSTAVMVRADREVVYDSVVRVLDAVKSAGLENLSLAVIKEMDR